ncbi:hypothetical protein GQ54DRAFT_298700 [Martensiomyces pterosporus]|nr:hypothetical protein GQ54DRAFT_298700 [Martensiomyces pterosporus]
MHNGSLHCHLALFAHISPLVAASRKSKKNPPTAGGPFSTRTSLPTKTGDAFYVLLANVSLRAVSKTHGHQLRVLIDSLAPWCPGDSSVFNPTRVQKIHCSKG